jgi:hypothetical protein
MPAAIGATPHDRPPSARIAWLDALRLVCAIEIVGHHWLRAGHQVGLFGSPNAQTIAEAFWGNSDRGFGALRLLLIDHRPTLLAAVDNVIGLAFGFGWEAANVFILLSGLTLGLTAAGRTVASRPARWFVRRLRRILLPYYCIAGPCLVAAFVFEASFSGSQGILGVLAGKIDGLLPGSWELILLEHVILLDPTGRQWVANFFAPAWWFVPAILLGYACFPAMLRCIERFGNRASLLLALGISAVSYRLVQDDVLLNNAWYYVVLNECFNFVLGIVVGRSLRDGGTRQHLAAFFGSARAAGIGLILFAAGNVLNWFAATYPIASPLFTSGMCLLFAWLAVRLVRHGVVARLAQSVDVYRLYLLHQPLAFPVAVLCAKLLGRFGLAAGLPIYLAIVGAVFAASELLVRRLATEWPRRRVASEA